MQTGTNMIGTMPTYPTRCHRSSGLTLIELLVTISILGILLAIAVPSFTSTMVRYQMDSVASDLAAFAAMARSEAISRSSRIVVCKSAAPNAADNVLACGGNWTDGWIMFEDVDTASTGAGDGEFTSGTNTVIRRRASTSWISIGTGGNYTTRFTYRSDGRPTTSDTFTLSDASGGGVGATTIVISSSGRVRITKN